MAMGVLWGFKSNAEMRLARFSAEGVFRSLFENLIALEQNRHRTDSLVRGVKAWQFEVRVCR